MRKLSKEETDISNRSILRLTERNKKLSYIIKSDALEVEEGCKFRYDLEIEKYSKDLENAKKESKENEEQIKTLRRQIREGIIPKDNKITG